MICSVFRPSRKKNGKTVYQRLYSGQYRLEGQTNRTRVPLHTPDKRVAEKRLQEIVSNIERESVGLAVPSKLRQVLERPLPDHLDDFIADLEARKNDSVYIYDTERRIRSLMNDCGWVHFGDITADSFTTWRVKHPKARKTLNDYLSSARNFVGWLCKKTPGIVNPLASVAKVKDDGTRVRVRRAFSFDELVRLVAVAGERVAMYLTAFYTGLRRNELESLTWGDVELDLPTPLIIVPAHVSKNRKAKQMALHKDVVAELRRVKPLNATPDTKLFRKYYRTKQFKADLKAAGLPYQDAQGRYLDFHSFRYGTNMNMAINGVSGRVRMDVMRHSDPRLTEITYADTEQLPTAKAITSLPSVMEAYAQLHAQSLVSSLPPESSVVQQTISPTPPNAPESKEEQPVLSSEVQSSQNKGMVGTTGFEGVAPPLPLLSQTIPYAQRDAQGKEPPPDLKSLMSVWGHLPKRVQQALLSIVEDLR